MPVSIGMPVFEACPEGLFVACVPEDVVLPPLAFDEDKPIVPNRLDDPGVDRPAVIAAVDDEIVRQGGGNDLVAVVVEDRVDAFNRDPVATAGKHPAVAIGEGIAAAGDDQLAFKPIGDPGFGGLVLGPSQGDNDPAIGEGEHPWHRQHPGECGLLGRLGQLRLSGKSGLSGQSAGVFRRRRRCE